MIPGLDAACSTGIHRNACIAAVYRKGRGTTARLAGLYRRPIRRLILQLAASAVHTAIASGIYSLIYRDFIGCVIHLRIFARDVYPRIQNHLSIRIRIAGKRYGTEPCHRRILAIYGKVRLAIHILRKRRHRSRKIPCTAKSYIGCTAFVVVDYRRPRRNRGKTCPVAHSLEILIEEIRSRCHYIFQLVAGIAITVQVNIGFNIAIGIEQIAAGGKTACRHAAYQTRLLNYSLANSQQGTILLIRSPAYINIARTIRGQIPHGYTDSTAAGIQR